MCKPHKANGVDRRTTAELRATVEQAEQLAEWWAALDRKANPRTDCFSICDFCDCQECRGRSRSARQLGGAATRLTVSMDEFFC